MKIDSVYIREANQEDINFIKNSWLKSYEREMADVPTHMYNKGQDKLMVKLMGSSTCYVACNQEEDMQIFGWMLFDKLDDIGILHYIYVKHPYRRYGIGDTLFKLLEHNKEYPVIASHKTLYYNYIKDKWNLVYNPYILHRSNI